MRARLMTVAAVTTAAAMMAAPVAAVARPAQARLVASAPCDGGGSLTFTTTSKPARPAPGDVVTYSVEVANAGERPAEGAFFATDLREVLDDASYVDGSASWRGDVPAGESVVVSYRVKVSGAGDGRLTTGYARTGCGRAAAAPDPRTVYAVSVIGPDKPYAPGEKGSFTVNLAGQWAPPGPGKLTIKLPTGTSRPPLTVDKRDPVWGSCTAGTGRDAYVCDISSFGSGMPDNADIPFDFVVDAGATPGALLNDGSAKLDLADDPDLGDNEARVSVRVTRAKGPRVVVNQADPAPPGGVATIKATVTNYGPSATGKAATLLITLPPRATPVGTGCAINAGAFECAVPAGLAVGAERGFEVQAKVDAGATAGQVLETGTANVALDGDPYEKNNEQQFVIRVTDTAKSDFKVELPAPAEAVEPGATLTLKPKATNNGPSTSTKATTLTITLPAGLTATDAPGCVISADKKSVTCTLRAGIAPGQETELPIKVLVSDSVAIGVKANVTAKLSGNPEDTVPDNDTADRELTVVGGPDVVDYGDAPDTYLTTKAKGGPTHLRGNDFLLGPGISVEADARATDTFDDGVTVVPLTVGQTSASMNVALTAVGEGTLVGWLDSDGNGTFEANERSAVRPVAAGATSGTLAWSRLPRAKKGAYLRVRLYEGAVTDPAPAGAAGVGGEVEDYPVDVRNADLEVTTVTPPAAKLAPGQAGTVKATITNKGPAPTVEPSTVTFTMPARSTAGGPLPPGCTADADRRTVTCTVAAPLTSVELEIPVVPDPNAPLGAKATGGKVEVANPADGNDANNSRTFDVEIADAAISDLSITATPPAALPPGGTGDVTLSVKNNGVSDTATAATVTLTLPTGVSAGTLPAGCTATGQTVTCTLAPGIAVASSKEIKLPVKVAANVAPSAPLTAQAKVKIDGDPEPANDTAPVPLTVGGTQADVDLKLDVNPAGPFAPGETTTLKATVTNNGPSDTAAATTVTITLPAKVSAGDLTGTGCTASGATVTCTTSDVIADGAKKEFAFPVKLAPDADTSHAYEVAGEVANADDTDTANNSDTVEVNTKDTAENDLRIAVTPPATAHRGATAELLVTVTNDGPSTTTSDSTVTLTLPARTSPGDLTGTGCTAGAGNTVTCVIPAGLGAGAAKPYRIPVRIDPSAASGENLERADGAKVANAEDPDAANNSADLSITVSDPALTIAKSAAGDFVPGGTVTYTVVLTNTGATKLTGATFADDLSGVTDDAVASGTSTWTGDLDPGDKHTVTYQVTVKGDPAQFGDGKLVNKVTSTTVGANCVTGTEPGCTVTNPLPRLTVTKELQDAGQKIAPDAEVTYLVTVKNPTAAAFPGAKVVDDLAGVADDATFVSATGGANEVAGKLTWTGDVAAGDTTSFTYKVKVKTAGRGDQILSNAVTAVGSNCASVACSVTSKVFDLAVAVQVDKAKVPPGGANEVRVTVTNAGVVAAAQPTTVTVRLPEHTTVSGPVAGCTADADGTALTCTLTDDLAAGARVELKIPVTVSTRAPLDTTLTPGSATVAHGKDGYAANNTAAIPMATQDKAVSDNDLVVEPPVGLFAGDRGKVKVVVTNKGPSDTTSASTVTITMPAGATVEGALPAGCALSSGVVTCTIAAGFANGTKREYAIPVRIAGTAVGTLSGGEAAVANAEDDVDANNTKPVTIKLARPAMEITKKSAPASGAVLPGGFVTYTVTVRNNGPAPVTGYVLTDDLSGVVDDAVFDTTPLPAGVTWTSPTLRWTGDIPAGETSTVTYRVRLKDPAGGGDGKLVNLVSGPDSNCLPGSGNANCVAGGTTVGDPKIEVKKTSVPASGEVLPGNPVTYTVVIKNSGTADDPAATFSDDLSDVLDDAVFDGVLEGGATFAAGKLSWTGPLAKGASHTVKYRVRLKDPAGGGNGKLVNVITAPDSNCPPGTTNPQCITGKDPETTVGKPKIEVKKTSVPASGEVLPGNPVTYTVVIKNSGTADDPSATFSDDLSGVLDDAVFDGVLEGGATFAAGKLTWTGPLAKGAAHTVKYRVRLMDPTGGGDGKLVNVITAPDSNCPPGTTNPQCITGKDPETTVGKPKIEVKKTSVPASGEVLPGNPVTYTVVIKNSGDADDPAAEFTDDLADVLDDAVFDGVLEGGATFAAGKLSWTGALAKGATHTVKYRIRLKDPAGGGNGKLVNVITAPDSNCPPGTTNPNCITGKDPETTVGKPKIEVKKTSDPASGEVLPGNPVTYTVVIKNSGTANDPSATFSDDLSGVLDDAVFDGVLEGGATFGAGKLTWTGPLAKGATHTVKYRIRLMDPAGGGDGKLVNVITAPDSNCPPGTTNPNCITGKDPETTVGKPKIEIKKTSVPASGEVLPGNPVVYTVVIKNSGTADAPSATFSDDLADVLDDAVFDGVLEGGATFAAGKLTWTGALAKGATHTVKYRIRLKDPAGGGNGKLVNVITAPDSNCPPGTTNPQCITGKDPETTVGKPKIEIKKSSVPASGEVLLGNPVVYTVVIKNSGTADEPAATFSDDLSGVLDDAVFDGVLEGGATFAAGKLTWTGPLAKGAAHTVKYRVRLMDPTGGGDGKLVNVITAPDSNCPPGTTNPNCITGKDPETTVGKPKIEVKKTSVPASGEVLPGNPVTYTVVIKNSGTADNPRVTFSDDLSEALDDAVFDGVLEGGATFAAGKLTWAGPLAKGATHTVKYRIRLMDPTGSGDGKLVNVVAAPDSNCPPGTTNPNCITGKDPETTVGKPKIEIKKTSVPASGEVLPGNPVTYTVVIKNSGDADASAATFSDDLSDVLDDAVFDGVLEGGATFAAGKLTWTGPLAKGATHTVKYRIRLKDPATGGNGKLVNVIAAPDSNCPPGTTNPNCITGKDPETTVGKPKIEIKKTSVPVSGEVLPGNPVTYTVVIKNSGTANDPSATFSDDLSGVLDDAVFDGVLEGGATFAAGKLTWTGPLAKGASHTVKYRIRLKDPTSGGDGKLVNVITAPDSNCPPGTTNPNCITGKDPETTVGKPKIEIKKTSIPASGEVLPGNPVTYTVVIKNSGTADDPAARFSDDLSDVLDDAVFDGVLEGGATFAAGKLTWTGPLAKGATHTVKYRIRLKDPTSGGNGKLVNVIAAPDSNCPPGTTNPNCITGKDPETTVGKPKIEIKKTSVPASGEVLPGNPITYTVKITNSGEAAAAAATFSDDLADVLDDADFVKVIEGDATLQATTLSWTGPLAKGASHTVRYQVRLKDPAAGGNGKLVNLITAPDSNCPPGTTNPNCITGKDPETTTGKPKITLKKASDPAAGEVPPGGLITYTVKVKNEGTADRTAYTFTDDLSKILDDADFEKALTSGLTRSGTKLTWVGDVKAGATVEVKYQVRLKDPVQGDGELVNLIGGKDSNCPPNSTNPNCATGKDPEIKPGTPKADVRVDMTGPQTVTAGEKVTYELMVTNDGPSKADDTKVTFPLDPNTEFVSGDGCTQVGDKVECDLGQMERGQRTPLKIIVRVKPETAPGTTINQQARVDSSTDDPVPGNNEVGRRVVTRVETVADVKVAFTEVPAALAGGTAGQVKLAVTNLGPSDAANVVTTVELDERFEAPTALPAECTLAGRTLTCSAGTLAGGATKEIVLSLTPKAATKAPDLQLRAEVKSDTPDQKPANNVAKAAIKVRSLSIIKKASVATARPGNHVVFTITIVNDGTADYTGAKVVDDLSGVIDDGDFLRDHKATAGGVFDYTEPKLTWTGDVKVGRTETITYTVRVPTRPGGSGDLKLVNTVTSAGAGVKILTGTAEVGIPNPTIKKDVDTTFPDPGQTVTYTLQLTNSGGGPVAGFQAVDDLSKVLDDATLDPAKIQVNGSAVRPVFDAKGKKLTWSGDLPPYTTVTIKYPVKVNKPNIGDQHLSNVVTTNEGNCVAGSKDPVCATASRMRLTINKVVAPKVVRPGSKITWTVTVTNNSGAAYKGLTLTDDLKGALDDGTYNKDAKSSGGGKFSFKSPVLTWKGDVPAKKTIKITYSVTDVPRKGDGRVRNVLVSNYGAKVQIG
ncbi:GEVED domain-containing protein [Nonomuraea sp. NPDC050556]|uniref:DUF7927 domain-containing protein n=1 Tax=Nonomuraea sp. NPDC050556 TaxID=3364369 RepID=UPI0037BACBAF